jgi:hypothetical protein
VRRLLRLLKEQNLMVVILISDMLCFRARMLPLLLRESQVNLPGTEIESLEEEVILHKLWS